MHHHPRRRPHLAARARPDSDRQQHDVGHGETGHRQTAQQEFSFRIVFLRRHMRIERRGAIAEIGNLFGNVAGADRLPAPCNGELAGRQIQPGVLNPGQRIQAAFDFGNAAAAFGAVNGELQRLRAIFGAAHKRRRVNHTGVSGRFKAAGTAGRLLQGFSCAHGAIILASASRVSPRLFSARRTMSHAPGPKAATSASYSPSPRGLKARA